MSADAEHDPIRDHRDHAALLALDTAAGTSVELMQASYRTQVFARHTHEYFTVGVMLRGTGTLWYRGATRSTRRGDVVVIPPGEVHTGGVGGSTFLSYLAVHAPAEVLAECADAHGCAGRPPDFTRPIIRDAEIAAELRRIDSLMRAARATVHPVTKQPAARQLDGGAVDDALTMAIELLVARHAGGVGSARLRSAMHVPAFVRRARQTIEDCYADNAETSLHALALRAGVTPFHLVRVFTQVVGLSPHRYLIQTRVSRARQLLARGVPASVVAAMTGFVDQSHLTTQFKRHVGTTPASYQRCFAPSPDPR